METVDLLNIQVKLPTIDDSEGKFLIKVDADVDQRKIRTNVFNDIIADYLNHILIIFIITIIIILIIIILVLSFCLKKKRKIERNRHQSKLTQFDQTEQIRQKKASKNLLKEYWDVVSFSARELSPTIIHYMVNMKQYETTRNKLKRN